MIANTPSWQRSLFGAAAFTLPGLLIRLGGGSFAYPLQLVAYGAAVVAAAFILAWACEAAQVDVANGLAVAAVAFVAILPEYVVEVNFAFHGPADYVTANLTGASRLLLGFGVAMPAALALLSRRWCAQRVGPLELPPSHRLELAILALSSVWALRGVVLGRLTLLDAAVLICAYFFYLRRTAAAGGDTFEPLGVAADLADLPRSQRRRWVGGSMLYAAAVILFTAVPFGHAALGTGMMLGISPYLLLQWLVPIATETPELVVAFVLLTHRRGGQSLAVLLSSAVSQYTLALGTLPIAYRLGVGTGPLPLQHRERIELLLTMGIALYAVAAMARLRLSRGDTGIMLTLFAVQFLLPAVFTRLLLAVVFLVLAIDVLLSEPRELRALLSAVRPGTRASPG